MNMMDVFHFTVRMNATVVEPWAGPADPNVLTVSTDTIDLLELIMSWWK
jgi:hypothetical protein